MTRLQPLEYALGQRFRVASVLGQTDISEFYEVREATTGQPFLLELVTAPAAANPNCWAECERQLHAQANLPRGGFARVAEVTTDEALGRCVVCESVPGPSLATLVATHPLSPEKVVALLDGLASAFDAAAGISLSHGGVTANNLFVSARGTAIVAEFGLSPIRQFQPSPWSGVLGWSAPEQGARGATWARNTDVYGLALIAFYALTGRSYFASMARGGPVDPNVLWGEMTAPPNPITGQDANIDRALARALAPNPGDRTASVAVLVAELRGALALGVPTVVAPNPVQKGLGGTMVMRPGESMPNIAEILSRAGANAAAAPKGALDGRAGTMLIQAPVPAAAASQAPPDQTVLGSPPPEAYLQAQQAAQLQAQQAAQLQAQQAAQLQAQQAQAAQIQAQQAQQATQVVPANYVAQALQPSVPPERSVVPPKKGAGMLLLGGVLGGLFVAMIGVAVGGYFYWKGLPAAPSGPVAGAAPPSTVATVAGAAVTAPATTPTPPSSVGSPDVGSSASPSAALPTDAPSAAASGTSDNLPPAEPATVDFTCKPGPCDKIECDGQDLGPLQKGMKVVAGEHTCEFTKAGYSVKKDAFTAVAGKRSVVVIKLEKAPASATEPTVPGTAASSSTKPKAKPGKPPACGVFIPCTDPKAGAKP